MRPRPTIRNRRAGISLIECLVYIGVSALILGLATAAFYQCWDNSVGLWRNADDIRRALHFGERWRADVRAATAALSLESTAGGTTLRIPHPGGEVTYQFATNTVLRRAKADGPWINVLNRVKSCRVMPDPRPHVTAWRLELELATYHKGARLRPLFSFAAVPIQLIPQ